MNLRDPVADASLREKEGYKTSCIIVFCRFRNLSNVFMCVLPAGDGKLSYREFLAVMKRWKLRGYKVCCTPNT